MALVPLTYNIRSIFRRRTSTLLTVTSIGATVAVIAGIFSLQQGFAEVFAETGREDVAVFLRPGASSEGESAFSRERAEILIKNTPEIAEADGQPLASAEMYLAVRLRKLDGGETNVPIRGVQPASYRIRAGELRVVEGRVPEPGADEVIVGSGLAGRIRGCQIDDVLTLNVTPYRVVGVFEADGPFASEIWGDVDRLMSALERPVYSRVIAQLRPDTDFEALVERLEDDKQVPALAQIERDYLGQQTFVLSGVLIALAAFLGFWMGFAAIFTGTNTMLSAVSARTHEIGILLSLGFRPFAIFVAFLTEALLLGVLGGIVGCLMVWPLNGLRTGTTNFQTFTEVAFAFRVTPAVLVVAVVFAVGLGLIGGAWPALRAAMMLPTEALRRV